MKGTLIASGQRGAKAYLASMLALNSALGGPYSDIAMTNFKYERDVPEFMPKKDQGRNEPCACGSGLKYKRCCGK